MGLVPILFVAAAVAAPPVQLSTLAGDEHRGELVQLNATSLTLSENGNEVELPLAELLGVRFTAASSVKPAAGKTARATFTDGTQIDCSKLTTTGRMAVLESPQLGRFDVALPALANIRFDDEVAAVEETWQKLCARELKRDLLVIKKKGDVVVLDHLEGLVGEIDEKQIKFLLDGQQIPLQREKIFGVIYARRTAEQEKPLCEALLHGGGRLQIKRLVWEAGRFTATLSAGSQVEFPAAVLEELDFSLGKVRYLSQMKPREVKYTPFFDIVFKYRRDRNLDGGPLRLGKRTFSRGLCIHSRTFLRYRINTDYRRFKAVMGIDYAVARIGRGDVHVVISGDGRTLLETDVRGGDESREIDLDVSDVRDLEILVDFGGDLDISDHLDLADARVTK